MIRESWRGGMRMKQIALIAAIALPSVAILSCNSIAKESAPVELVVSGTQNLNQIDLQAGAAGCATSLGTVRAQRQAPAGSERPEASGQQRLQRRQTRPLPGHVSAHRRRKARSAVVRPLHGAGAHRGRRGAESQRLSSPSRPTPSTWRRSPRFCRRTAEKIRRRDSAL